MFSLIITIISIALVAALALATLYYGGTAFNKGSATAEASRLINEGQQVNGAVTMHSADLNSGATTTAVTDLTSLVTATYLSSVPSSFAATTLVSAGQVTAEVGEKVCVAVRLKATGDTFGCAGVGSTPVGAGADTILGTADDVAATIGAAPFTFSFKI
jgi:type II secretory pathway pseudopilin PulG